MMIDPSIIEAKIEQARARDSAVTEKLRCEVARLVCVQPGIENVEHFSPDAPTIRFQVRPARFSTTGVPSDVNLPAPQNGSYANQLFSAIMFAVDARAELKLLDLIASPHFYSALMRSAAEVPEP